MEIEDELDEEVEPYFCCRGEENLSTEEYEEFGDPFREQLIRDGELEFFDEI